MPINIKDKKKCSGCTACQQICPKHCINMFSDNEGFLYPKVDLKNCINCGLCEKACPDINPLECRLPINCYAVKNKNLDIRKESSSGGVFSLLAEKVLSQKGVVFGARFDSHWQVVMDYTENIEGLDKFRGSKYVKCDIGNTYSKVKDFLSSGRKVLYSGSSCQIAGLRKFLKHDYENLLFVDYLCHGAPSPLLWKKYIEEISRNDVSSLTNISFRNKKRGWKNFSIIIKRGKEVLVDSVFSENIYMRAFLADMSLRPSCYQCSARNGHSGADITIGDHWAIRDINSSFDDNEGVSLVLINTEKGSCAFEDLNANIIETDFVESKKWNGAFYDKTEEHLHRKRFFRKLQYRTDVSALIEDELNINLWDHIKKRLLKITKQKLQK